ncbi:MAG: hypothetical protein S4CHLAM102_16470 [Chlamydiia bacterium]|nr:hypothetical protein [Chlamydiia bacterium]
MVELELIAYIFIGLVAGSLAGMLGIGGGIVTVPLLILVFKYLQFPPDTLIQLAIGTSLSAMVINSFFSFISHAKHRRVVWGFLKYIIPGLVVGSYFGAIIAKSLSGEVLKTIFGGFEIVIAIWFLFGNDSKANLDTKLNLPSWYLGSMGVGIGTIATMMGIGGGQITLPLLTQLKLPLTRAIGTSAAISFIVSLAGSLAYTIPNLGIAHYHDSIGYLYLPAFIPISITCFFITPAAARMSSRIPTYILRAVFSSILVITGITLIFF